MRTIEYGTTTHVPAFLTKLWKLVTDALCDDLISWSLAGTSFIIYDEIRFSKELLPMYFKHNNMASFVRQLNMYGFRKLSCIDQGGMHCYKNEIEFYHQYFLKGQEKLLELIKRKIPNSKSEEPKVKQEYLEELISNIRSLQGQQDTAEQNMKTLKKENKILWRHIGVLTERYTKQQTVIQQLLPFFMDMVRSSREITMKRKAPLMIDEGETRSKLARISPPYYVHSDDSNSGMPSSPGNVSNRGPVIHDVTELECSQMYPGSVLYSSPPAKESEAVVDSPLSCSLESSDAPAFTEAGSMETFNILNQNYERRSRSNSLNAPMTRSPGVPRARCSTMTSHSSLESYQSSRAPTAVVIDETTSDVPFSGSPFVPKIESTCTSSNLYSMLNQQVSSIINDEATTLLSEGAPLMSGMSAALSEQRSMMNGRSPQMMNDASMSEQRSMMTVRSPQMMNDASMSEQRSMMSGISPQMMNDASMSEQRSMISSRSPQMMNDASMSDPRSAMSGRSPQMMNESTSLMSGNAPPMMSQMSPPPMNESTPMMSGRSPPLLHGNTAPMMRSLSENMPLMDGSSLPRSSLINSRSPPSMSGSASVMNSSTLSMSECASTSAGNAIIQNSKREIPQMNWMPNQNSTNYTSESIFDNWLGQIMKSENVPPGSSMPQTQAENAAETCRVQGLLAGSVSYM